MDHDIIIVGSGPAGLSTGLNLLKIAPDLAHRVLILEKARHPRPKLCGGGVTPDAEVCLQHLGLDMREVPHVEVPWANFWFEGRGFKMRSDKVHAFHVVRRDEFDGWLAGKTRERGLLLQEETTVRRVRATEENVEVETSHGVYRAQLVVGADGANSVVRRAVVPPGTFHQLARLIEVLVPPPSGPVSGTAHVPDEAYFDFAALRGDIQGYVWRFPTQVAGQPMYNWGVYDSRVDSTAPRGSLPATLEAEICKQGYSPDDYELQGHPLRWFNARGTFSGPRILLVGDAAGVDALYGEGISPALGYGEIAAQAIADAFATRDFSLHDYRERVLAHPLGRALRRRTALARLIYRLRELAIQRLIWWHSGAVLRWFVNTFLINWAK